MLVRHACVSALAAGALVLAAACAWPGLEAQRAELVRRVEASAPAQPGAAGDPLAGLAVLEREVLVDAALRRNPTLESARLAWRGALARYPQEIALDDPMLGAMWAPNAYREDTVRGGYRLELRQGLPFPGKRALRGEAALLEAEAAGEDYEAARLRLAAAASQLFDDWYLSARELEINAEHLRLLGELQQSALARLEAGLGGVQEALQAESELAELLHREVKIEADRAVIGARIDALLHRTSGLAVPPPPATLPAQGYDEAMRAGDGVEALVERALEANPELRAAAQRSQAREAALALARRAYLPDLEVQAVYDAFWQEHELRPGLGVAVELPLQVRRRRAAVEEARAELERARREEARIADAVRLEVVSATQRLREAAHLLELSRERRVPAARQRVAALRAAFANGETTFFELIDAERSLRAAQLEQESALAQLSRRRAQLARALGEEAGREGGTP